MNGILGDLIKGAYLYLLSSVCLWHLVKVGSSFENPFNIAGIVGNQLMFVASVHWNILPHLW